MVMTHTRGVCVCVCVCVGGGGGQHAVIILAFVGYVPCVVQRD